MSNASPFDYRYPSTKSKLPKRRNSCSSPVRLSHPTHSNKVTQASANKQPSKKKRERGVRNQSLCDSYDYESLFQPNKRQGSAPRNSVPERRSVPSKPLARDLYKLEALINPTAENSKLRNKVKELQKTVKKQNRALDDLYQRVLEERTEVKTLTGKIYESRKNDILVLELQERLESMQDHEAELVGELREQQARSNEMITKLQILQEESRQEMADTKRLYQEMSLKKSEEELEELRKRVKTLEGDKGELIGIIKELQKIREVENEGNLAAAGEVNELKLQLEIKVKENSILKSDVKKLKRYIKEEMQNKVKDYDVEELQEKVEELMEENKKLKLNEIKKIGKSGKEKYEEMEKRVKVLENEILVRDQKYEQMDKYYKGQLEIAKRTQEQRKREWLEIYNELLREIKQLKSSVNSLDTEQQNPISSGASRHSREDFES